MKTKIDFKTPSYNKSRTISISSVLDMISEPFDGEKVAQNTFEKNYNNPDSKYYHMTKEQILESWAAKGAESCRYGSQLDDYIGLRLTGSPEDVEMFKLDYVDGDERMEGLCASFDKFYDEYIATGKLTYIDREKYMYHEVEVDGEIWHVRGRFDALFWDNEHKNYIIIDWKSNGDIEVEPNRYTKRFLGPAKILYALSGYRYITQVFFYKLCLETLDILEEGESVKVGIVNLPGYDTNKEPVVKLIGAIYPYEKTFIESILKYAIKKKQLLEKKGEVQA